MSVTPDLLHLTGIAQSSYPNVPPATAVLAYSHPDAVQNSLVQVTREGEILQSLEGTAEQIYGIAMSKPHGPDVSIGQSGAAQLGLDAKNLQDEHRRSVELAEAVKAHRRKLAMPMRIATTLLCTLAMFAGGDATVHELQHPQSMGQEELSLETVVGALGLGLLVGVNAEGNILVGLEARRRARRIARRQA
jgi:hypothetical protein